MTCDEVRQLLHAYLDDELDVATSMQMEGHLPDCAECRRELESLQVVRAAVAQPEIYSPASPALRDRLQLAIRSELGKVDAGPHAQHARPWWSRPRVLSGLAAVLVLGVGVIFLLLPGGGSQGQVAELVGSHVRSLEANHLLDVVSTDQHTVKPWFDGKTEFSPPVVDLASDGFPLIGGRLDYLFHQKVAALIYRRNKHIINVFVWPGSALPETDEMQGFNLIRFQCNGMICWAVSDLNVTELQQFVDQFKAKNPPTPC